ncbi:hypothetical protein CN690_12420 [Bacillus wiedmannii]|nr:hypothetical protein CN690_12420 [Bacillus wiedmannii]PEL81446.1 hypothetical protein CN609_12950 [Bacillus wiedmannii]
MKVDNNLVVFKLCDHSHSLWEMKRIGHYVKGDSAVHVIKNMDHSLKSFERDFKVLELQKNYKEGAGKPLHPMLEEIIVNWMSAHFISQYEGNKTSSSK